MRRAIWVLLGMAMAALALPNPAWAAMTAEAARAPGELEYIARMRRKGKT